MVNVLIFKTYKSGPLKVYCIILIYNPPLPNHVVLFVGVIFYQTFYVSAHSAYN